MLAKTKASPLGSHESPLNAVGVKNQARSKDFRGTFFIFLVRKIKPLMSDEHTWGFFHDLFFILVKKNPRMS